MAGFDAGTQVEPLDYNFDTIATMYPGRYPLLENVQGTTDEPSDEDVQKLQRRMRAATKDLIPEGIDPDDKIALVKATRDLPEDAFRTAEAAILDAIADLTAGKPSRDQIAALPFRVRRKYIQWVQRQLMDPEGSNAATTV